ncbi:MAG: peptidyl-prolyl cis-trans isomerase [Candidatus Omnitrophota bacterium]|nr:peptidyl-prolyl cis-trans isomerase [Candidatus Omnitrophota bacterium]
MSLIFLMGAFIISAGGCARKASIDDKVLASVSNRNITLRDFKARISQLPKYYQNIVDKDRRMYLDEMIMEALFHEEVVRKGVERDRDVRDLVAAAKKKIAVAKLLKSEVEDKVTVAEDDIRAFYESHKDDFKTPDLWRASHILVSNEKEAKDVLDALSRGESFEELAQAHSIDATASRGGDIGIFRTGQLIPEFEKACLELSVGQTSGVIHTQFGYHVIKLTDRRLPGIESYDLAKKRIESELKKANKKDLFDRYVSDLRNKYGVTVREDISQALDSIGNEKEKVAGK